MLSLNFGKIVYHRLCIDNWIIERINSYKYLGITLDAISNYNCHLNNCFLTYFYYKSENMCVSFVFVVCVVSKLSIHESIIQIFTSI